MSGNILSHYFGYYPIKLAQIKWISESINEFVLFPYIAWIFLTTICISHLVLAVGTKAPRDIIPVRLYLLRKIWLTSDINRSQIENPFWNKTPFLIYFETFKKRNVLSIAKYLERFNKFLLSAVSECPDPSAHRSFNCLQLSDLDHKILSVIVWNNVLKLKKHVAGQMCRLITVTWINKVFTVLSYSLSYKLLYKTTYWAPLTFLTDIQDISSF